MRAALLKEHDAMAEPVLAAQEAKPTSLDPGALRVLLAVAAYQARRVARTLRLSDVDREEAEHQIMVALLERRRFFDPARGPWTPFAHRIARQAAQSVADSFVADRRLHMSLDQPMDSVNHVEPTMLADTLQDYSVPTENAILDAVSLGRFVTGLPSELRIVAEAALEADGELAEAQRALGLSTSEFYRRIREIRYRLFTVGLVDRRSLLDR